MIFFQNENKTNFKFKKNGNEKCEDINLNFETQWNESEALAENCWSDVSKQQRKRKKRVQLLEHMAPNEEAELEFKR
jgi:hypothetical protein